MARAVSDRDLLPESVSGRSEETPRYTASDLRIVRWLVWSGPFTFAVVAAGMLIAGFIPPHPPSASAEAIAREFIEHATWIKIGCSLVFIGACFWATWNVAIAFFMRRMEKGMPLLTSVFLVLAAAGTVIYILPAIIWLVAAFRPEAVPPQTTRMLNDAAWLMFVWTVPSYSLAMVMTAVAIFRDGNTPRVLPRWIAYLNLLFAIDLFSCYLVAFFKEGPLAWNGVVSFWNPVALYLTWAIGMTVGMLQALRREEDRLSRMPQ